MRTVDRGGAIATSGREARMATMHPGMIVAVVALLVLSSRGGATAPPPADVEVFSRDGCPHCVAAERFLHGLAQERPDVHVVVHDVGSDPAALARLRALAAAQGRTAVGVPTFLVRGELIVGFAGPDTTGREILRRLAPGTPPAGDPDGVDLPVLGPVTAGAIGLPAFTIVLGLLDGFNPCAMWVLLFVLSLLVNLHDRRRMLAIGGTFVAVSGLVYFGFMAAWLNAFLVLGHSRSVESLLGVVALAIGAVNLKDGLGHGGGPSLGIPEAAKPGIYARARRIVYAEHWGPALAGAVVLAVLVNLVELLCTAGLPAVYTHVLARQQLPAWQHYAYLCLYAVAYMLDDAVVLTASVATLERFKLGERGGRRLKLLSGMVMAALGGGLLAGRLPQP